jgi:anthranilate synthase component I
MNRIKLNTTKKTLAGDIHTPVQVYLKIRDAFPFSILLESSDYHGNEHSYSYICFDPIAKFEVSDEQIQVELPGQAPTITPVKEKSDVLNAQQAFYQQFDGIDRQEDGIVCNGVFGFTSYDAVRYFEDVEVQKFEDDSRRVPDMLYRVYRNVLVFNHFNSELLVFNHSVEGQESNIDEVIALLNKKDFIAYDFKTQGDVTSNVTDQDFMDMVQKGKDHCQRGDVFQIVVSRRFKQQFEGDDFQVYRALRSINPSPYLFYYDFGNFKIFGSSPEAQIVIKDGKASIFPIAGTFRRTGKDKEDYDLAKKLFNDPKEVCEHIMLVDLARNDLSRHGSKVTVETLKEIQYYSHVIHMVSKVTGQLDKNSTPLQLVADTFPAGTLSGAPKHMAMGLINKYENSNRGLYGGAIGMIGFDGTYNHAIMIRTFLSKSNQLYYQAGAGVVAKSVVENELQEVNNKLAALSRAMEIANEMKN